MKKAAFALNFHLIFIFQVSHLDCLTTVRQQLVEICYSNVLGIITAFLIFDFGAAFLPLYFFRPNSVSFQLISNQQYFCFLASSIEIFLPVNLFLFTGAVVLELSCILLEFTSGIDLAHPAYFRWKRALRRIDANVELFMRINLKSLRKGFVSLSCWELN